MCLACLLPSPTLPTYGSPPVHSPPANAPAPARRYPYDWRTKKPTIFRATDQWFASVEGFRCGAPLRVRSYAWGSAPYTLPALSPPLSLAPLITRRSCYLV